MGSTPTAAAAGTITVEETYPTRYLPNRQTHLGEEEGGAKGIQDHLQNIQQIHNERRNNTLENYAMYIFCFNFIFGLILIFFSFLGMVIMTSAQKKNNKKKT